ncbi:hypothetical protein SAMN05421823_102308 [Catalinimonas alkaloidigena]|uniref:YD repeat-containing protein n=1 Tax=Catalinimonas alkaloidigena TaxID=1075417 RepID=A0A1G9AHV3_9BACT|nr:hypothetical protein [Catalinimonas alkaloidigena]SDK26939.1 hypothetical protein SAMN05421823_102308 [Catalinimonas alkaloidigena]
MRFLMLLLVSLVCSPLAAQFTHSHWCKGWVVTNAGDTITGEVSYHVDEDVLILRERGTWHTYTSQTVASFVLQDTLSGEVRRFRTYTYDAMGNHYEVPLFFEVFFEGKHVALLGKVLPRLVRWKQNRSWERITSSKLEENIEGNALTQKYLKKTELHADFYLIRTQPDARPVRCTKGLLYKKYVSKRLYGFLADRKEALTNYARARKIQFQRPSEFLTMLVYYEHLMAQEPQAALRP